MNILIIEPTCRGHHPIYLSWIAKGASQHGHQVIIASASHCINHPVISKLKDDMPDIKWVLSDRHHDEPKRFRRLFNQVRTDLAYRSNLSRLFSLTQKQYPIDQVFVPYLDFCFRSLALLGSPFGSVPWSAIIMRGSFHFSDMGIKAPNTSFSAIKRHIFLRVLGIRSLKHLFTIDESLHEYVNKIRPDLSSTRLRYLPDPVGINGNLTRSEARTRLGIPENAPVVLVYGGLTLRKGIHPFVQAVAQSPECSQIHVLLAGRQGKSLEAQLQAEPSAETLRAQGRLHEIKRFLTSEEEYCVFRATDFVWVGYTSHFWMSSVLAIAGMMNLPVIGCDTGVIGWWIRRNRVGVCFEDTSSTSIARALNRLIRDRQSFSDPERAARLARQHSIKHAQDILFGAPDSEGIPASPSAGLQCQNDPA